ncbi:MAG: hypothetical protein QM736_09925 [Vicinamibacterales bacterium]
MPSRHGTVANRLPVIARWKILDNLRRSIVAPVTVLLLVLGWTTLPGSPALWTIAILGAFTFSLSESLIETVAWPTLGQPLLVLLRTLAGDIRMILARAALQIAFLAYHAWAMAHAIGLTLVRLVVTRRRMLEWQTAAGSARLLSISDRDFFMRQMVSSFVVAGICLLVVLVLRPSGLISALPVLVLWAAAPALACRLSRPPHATPPALTADDRRFLRIAARKTWRYFDTFTTAADSDIPPDNVQETTDRIVAHRTSPTNIGMGLLAPLAAFDLGFIDLEDLLNRIERTLATLDSDGAARRASAQLVRHENAPSAGAALRVHCRQRQSRRGAHHAGSRPLAARRTIAHARRPTRADRRSPRC